MRNLFKSRNFDGHLDNFVIVEPELDFTVSDSIYDKNRGITHCFVRDNCDNFRIVSDVEICMSDSPEITSTFPAEYRMRLRSGILGSSRPVSHNGNLSDDDLIALHTPERLERDEVVNLSKARLRAFHDKAVDTVFDKMVSDRSPATPSTDSDTNV